MAAVEEIVKGNNLCGEGPIWDVANQRLIWNDLSSSLVFQYTPADGKHSTISTGIMAAGIALNRDGRLVLAGATGVHLWRGDKDVKTILTQHDGETLFFNDICAAPNGRLYAGTCYWGANGMEKLGKLYLLCPDGSVKVAAEDIEMSNGIGLSPDARTLYFADTSRRVIFAYDVDPKSGALSKRREFVRVSKDEGLPDGLTVDADGFVWSAQWYGSQVVRYDPSGKVERRIPTPAKQTSSVMFGGKDLTDLYITSAGDSWTSNYAPPAYDFKSGNFGGSLYRVRLGTIRGREEYRTDLK
jgi:sugar lactone lactonase YvrE